MEEILKSKKNGARVFIVATYRDWQQGEEFDETHYFDYHLIEAEDERAAISEYRRITKVTYFFPHVIVEASTEFIEFMISEKVNLEKLVDNKFIDLVSKFRKGII